MYSVSKKYADFQQNLFWKHKDPRCIQDEVMSYRGIKFLEKIDRKAVPQQQQQTEKDRDADQEIKLMAKGIEVFERFRKNMTIPRKEKSVDKWKTVDRVESDKDEKIKNLTKTILQLQMDATARREALIKDLKEQVSARDQALLNAGRDLQMMKVDLSLIHI